MSFGPTFGSLFAGIGGIDLGLERAGFACRWQVEWDPFCQHVLAHHWPDVPRHGDIHGVHGQPVCPVADAEGRATRRRQQQSEGRRREGSPAHLGCESCLEPVDLIAGGFPCQPVSIAGRQRAQDDDRWLWPEFARAIRELRPRLVLVENVRNLLAVGDGGPFGEVLGDLAALGYDAEWDCIPAAAVGAPHLRDRVWIVAHAERTELRHEPEPVARGGHPSISGDDGPPRTLADASRDGIGRPRERAVDGRPGDGGHIGHDAQQGTMADAESESVGSGLRTDGPGGIGRGRSRDRRGEVPDAGRERLEGLVEGRAASRPVDGPGDGRDPGWWAVEPDVGRVAHGVPARVDRLRALGNAVVPQVVEMIGRRMLEFLEPEGAGP